MRPATLSMFLGLVCGWSCRPVSPPPPPTITDAPTPPQDADGAPCEAGKLPDDPAIGRFQAVVRLLDDPTRDAVVAFARDHATPEMELRWPVDDQVAILESWRTEAGPAIVCRVVERTDRRIVGVIGLPDAGDHAPLHWVQIELDPSQDGRVVQFQRIPATEAALRAERPIGVPLVTRSVGGAPVADDPSKRQSLVEANLVPSIRPEGPRRAHALTERMAQLGVPGVSIAVIHQGRIDWAQGYGVRHADEPRPVDTETVFQAASMSKPVTALAALRMVHDGVLDLDTDVNTYLKTWTVPDSEHTIQRPPTIRDIASHCAGFTVHGFPGYAQGAPVPTVPQILDGSPPANTPPVRVDKLPGAGFRYSGGGTTVLQLLLMDVAGQAFPQIMAREVLQRVGMPRSTYEQPLPKRLHANAAAGHGMDGQAVQGRWHTYPEMAAAGLWTTPRDLATLLIDVRRTFLGEGGELLPTAMVQDALGRQCPGMAGLPGSAAAYVGLGFMVAPRTGDLRFGHGGANMGFRGQMLIDARRGSGVVVMTNSDNGSLLVDEVVNAVAHVYGWPAHELQEVPMAPLDTAAFDRVAGRYAVVPDPQIPVQRITFARDGDSLRAEIDDEFISEMFPTGEQTYLLLTPFFVHVEFGEDEGRSQVELHFGGATLKAVRESASGDLLTWIPSLDSSHRILGAPNR